MVEAAVANSLPEQIAIEQVGEDEYVSTKLPGQLGNTKQIAYGGCSTAVAVHAACKTVKDGFNLYSVLGYFLGPSFIDYPVRCRVYRSRDTRTFATRRVVVSQILPGRTTRTCLELIADFQAIEPAVAMAYTPPPIRQYEPLSQASTTQELQDQFVAQGKISKERVSLLGPIFSLMEKFFEQKPCVEGVSGQNMMGFAKHQPTDQDRLLITDKYSAEWMRARDNLSTPAEQLSALAFNMDAGLCFLPLIHDHKFLEDVGDCSSLDFALRIFSNDINLTKWHVKERRTIAGEGGRTYSEARLFDEGGRLVAIESQQSIMRPLPVNAVL